jgi:hypothetical protein
MHTEGLHDLHSASDVTRVIKSRAMRQAESVAAKVENRNTLIVSVGNAEGKRRLKRPKRRREDNIEIDLKKLKLESVD